MPNHSPNLNRNLAWIVATFAVIVLSVGLRMTVFAEQTGDLKIHSETTKHTFAVELAFTPEEQAKGLMHRTSLGEDEGMLFVYPTPVETAFWMKNTLISLDMIFIDEDGKIVRITANTRPLSLTPRPAPSPVVGVLEINGGRAAELGIQVGDIVTHPSLPE